MAVSQKQDTIDFYNEFEQIKAEVSQNRDADFFGVLKQKLGDKPLIICPAGRLGLEMQSVCADNGITAAAFCDRMVAGAYNNVPVITPQKLKENYPDAVVMVCSATFNDEITRELSDIGFGRECIISCPIGGGAGFMTTSRFEEEGHLAGYASAYGIMRDKRSKQTVTDRVRMYLCNKPAEKNSLCDEYFEEGIIYLENNEIFIDAGAFTGDTAELFIKHVNGHYKHIYCFEPDSGNYQKAVERLSGFPSVTIFNKGLFSRDTELAFFENSLAPQSSRINSMKPQGEDPDTGKSISVSALDNLFNTKPDSELPTFIKMDIEGAEKEALTGAANTIKRTKPKLAIAAYHKTEDIYVLPLLILSFRDDYKFYLRCYLDGAYETVLYAV